MIVMSICPPSLSPAWLGRWAGFRVGSTSGHQLCVGWPAQPGLAAVMSQLGPGQWLMMAQVPLTPLSPGTGQGWLIGFVY